MTDHDNDEFCHGAKAIGNFTGLSESAVYQRVKQGLLPVGRLGGSLFASKAVLRDYLDRLARGEILPARREQGGVTSNLTSHAPHRGRGRPRKEVR